MENNLEKVIQSIQNLKDKKGKIYFLVQDTKGNAKASIRYIYQMVWALRVNNFDAQILHEKEDFTPVSSWLDSRYSTEIPHQSIEGKNLQVAPEDFIVIPEIFGFIMEQIKNIPCGKIVLSQSYSYITETLQPGQTWAQNGFLKCITTTENQKTYIESIMRQSSVDVVEPIITDIFTKRNLPPLPIVAIHSREQSDAINLIKTFYLKYPQFRWFTFKDMRALSEQDFVNSLQECFLSVWIDEHSSFGTFPIESMSCGVPVMGLVPYFKHDWMNESNGIWTTEKVSLPDFIADFIQNWLEDNVKDELIDEGLKMSENFKNVEKFNSRVNELFERYINVRIETLEKQLNNNL